MIQTFAVDRERKRRIAMNNDFLYYQYNGKKTNDLLYCLLYYLATYDTQNKCFYLTFRNYRKKKKDIKELCTIGTDRTLQRQIEILLESGLVQKGTIKENNEILDCFYFKYEVKEKYILITCEMLFYLISTRNRNAVRVYCVLLDWYKWKKKEQSFYEFSIKDIMKALGYETEKDTNTLIVKAVENILESFKNEGVIDYKETYYKSIDKNGNTRPIPKKILLFVADEKKQVPTRNATF